MTDQEINARCAALVGIADGAPFDPINNESDGDKLIEAQLGIDLSELWAQTPNDQPDDVRKVAFRRLIAEAHAALPRD